MSDTLNKYVHVPADGNTILVTLPVPLGSTVYQIRAECDGYCGRHDISHKDFSCRFPGGVCYTIPVDPKEVTLTLANTKEILEGFGKAYFATKEEAVTATKNLVEYNRASLAARGVRW